MYVTNTCTIRGLVRKTQHFLKKGIFFTKRLNLLSKILKHYLIVTDLLKTLEKNIPRTRTDQIAIFFVLMEIFFAGIFFCRNLVLRIDQ